MKKVLFSALVLSSFSFFWLSVPAQVRAQGVGLRCDTPHCRYAPYDRGGHWYGEGRHDYYQMPLPIPGYYVPVPYPYPDTVYARGGISIMNPTPGTSLKVEKKSGGFICSLFNFCSEEKVDFSTARPQAVPPSPQPASLPAEPAEKIKEEMILPAPARVFVSGDNMAAVWEVIKAFQKKGFAIADSKMSADKEARVTYAKIATSAQIRLGLVDIQTGLKKIGESPPRVPPKDVAGEIKALGEAAAEAVANL